MTFFRFLKKTYYDDHASNGNQFNFYNAGWKVGCREI